MLPVLSQPGTEGDVSHALAPAALVPESVLAVSVFGKLTFHWDFPTGVLGLVGQVRAAVQKVGKRL